MDLIDPAMITKSRLMKERGWTEWAIVEFLGDPDEEQPNPFHRNAASMQLYAIERVQGVEQSAAFRRWQEERAARTRGAAHAQKSQSHERPGRPRLYACAADRQAAYRERKRQEREAGAAREQSILEAAETLRRTIRDLARLYPKKAPFLPELARLDTADLLEVIGEQYVMMCRTRQLPTSSGSAKRRRPPKDPGPAETYDTEPLMRRYRLEPPRHDPH